MTPRDRGLVMGAIGVAIFAISLPATRLAVQGLDPWFVTGGRAAIAGALAALFLAATRAPIPRGGDWLSLGLVAGGVVIGFPLLTALALQIVPSTHGILFVGFLPCLTALCGIWRIGEKPRPGFWLWALLGGAAILVYAWRQSDGQLHMADGLLIGAILACAIGYAEGARLSRGMGADRAISWALILALPLTLPVAILFWPDRPGDVSLPAWGGFLYVSIFSMFVGFLFWYRGLAWGGIARVGQLQLLQPFLALGFAHLLLGETIGLDLGLAASVVVFAVLRARRYV